MLVVNSDKLSTVQRLHRNVGWFRVNRPQLISLNGRPGLFPGTQMLLLRHLLNCSLFLPSKSSKTNWFLGSPCFDPGWTFGAIFLRQVPGGSKLASCTRAPKRPIPGPVLDPWTVQRTTRHRLILLVGMSQVWWPTINHQENHSPTRVGSLDNQASVDLAI